jgi:superfamily II helicase
MRQAKYQCKVCFNKMEVDVPTNETATGFAEKLACKKCGHVGCSYRV